MNARNMSQAVRVAYPGAVITLALLAAGAVASQAQNPYRLSQHFPELRHRAPFRAPASGGPQASCDARERDDDSCPAYADWEILDNGKAGSIFRNAGYLHEGGNEK